MSQLCFSARKLYGNYHNTSISPWLSATISLLNRFLHGFLQPSHYWIRFSLAFCNHLIVESISPWISATISLLNRFLPGFLQPFHYWIRFSLAFCNHLIIESISPWLSAAIWLLNLFLPGFLQPSHYWIHFSLDFCNHFIVESLKASFLIYLSFEFQLQKEYLNSFILNLETFSFLCWMFRNILSFEGISISQFWLKLQLKDLG